MKKTSYFLLTLLFLMSGIAAFAGKGNDKGKKEKKEKAKKEKQVKKNNKHCKAEADFVFSIDSCTVSFIDSSIAGNNTIIKKWEWKFGDGSKKSKLQNPTHTYTSSGTYNVCLTVKTKKAKLGQGKKCKKNTICKSVTVTACGGNPIKPCDKMQLKPQFSHSVDSCTVKFADASKADTGVTILRYLWSFGDGDTAIGKTPVHKYQQNDHYTVCLTIVGVRGKDTCKETRCEKIDVKKCAKKFVPDPLDRVMQQPLAGKAQHALEVYPNPASSSANIGFELKNAGQVAVTVTDMQGRTIATLQNGYLLNGNHTLNWNLSQIPAGVYLITVKTADKVEQKQLMLQK